MTDLRQHMTKAERREYDNAARYIELHREMSAKCTDTMDKIRRRVRARLRRANAKQPVNQV